MIERARSDGPTASSEHVAVERRGALALITLDRPRAINALTLDMVRAVREHLDASIADPAVETIAIRGAGDRGLCAGGDVAALARARLEDRPDADRAAREFFRAEYRLNDAISRAATPVVALMDGVVLGGGVGVSAHASHRIVTERSKVGMPEVGIGMFPDVGGTWLLGRAGGLGVRMALTGVPVGAGEAIAAGLADAVVPSGRLDEVLRRLETEPADAVVASMGGGAEREPAPEWLPRLGEAASLDEALAVLREAAADHVLEVIATRSPTSLRVTFEAVRRARALPSLRETLRVEYRLAVHLTAGHDFAEGVRAQLIDKDRTPRWSPASLAEVRDDDVDAAFAPLDGGDELTFD